MKHVPMLHHMIWTLSRGRSVFGGGAPSIGEAVSAMREGSGGGGSISFLRLSMNLLGDPAMPVWKGRPVRPDFTVSAKDGEVRVVLRRPAAGPVPCPKSAPSWCGGSSIATVMICGPSREASTNDSRE